MAKASVKYAPVPTPPIESVTLMLTLEEARVLSKVTHLIGGEPDVGNPRACMDNIDQALCAVGIDAPSDGSWYRASGHIVLEKE